MIHRCIATLGLLFALTGCVHKMDVEQGNVISQEAMKNIHVGMTADEVENQLGAPILSHAFDKKQLDYVYTYHPGNGKTAVKYVTLTFQHERLSKIGGNLYSPHLAG